MDVMDLRRELLPQAAVGRSGVHGVLRRQQLGLGRFTTSQKLGVSSLFVPNVKTEFCSYKSRQYEGKFSANGELFALASSDGAIRVFDVMRKGTPGGDLSSGVGEATSGGSSRRSVQASERAGSSQAPLKTVATSSHSPRSIDFSSDGSWIAYSGLSDSIYLCDLRADSDKDQEILVNAPSANGWCGFCIFSVCFSPDGSYVLGGGNDSSVYLIERNAGSIAKMTAHADDVNAIAFLDDKTSGGNHTLLTGGDDNVMKMWDLRTSLETPVVTLYGHSGGITSISSRKDGQYLLTNGKDSKMKLWDLRRVTGQSKEDVSALTFEGHKVSRTLIRCSFSPQLTTGSRFALSGSSSGSVRIYDILTGELRSELQGHSNVVRDVSWHPTEPLIATSSFDGTVGMWRYVSPSLLSKNGDGSVSLL